MSLPVFIGSDSCGQDCSNVHHQGTVEFNVLSTINLLEAMRILSLKTKWYQASSSEMYGQVKSLPITEEHTIHPVSPYGISKAAAHWVSVNYREAYGLYSCCGILFNHESVLRGRQFVTKKIISAVARIKKGSREVLVLGDLEIERDWGYAPDYVKAMWSMLQQDQASDYVIATGESHSLKEFVAVSFGCVDLEWQQHVSVDPKFFRPSDIRRIYGDSTKARKHLKWSYNLSFEDLVKNLVEEEIRIQ